MKLTYPFKVGRVGTADRASLHTVWLLVSQNAPLTDAVPI